MADRSTMTTSVFLAVVSAACFLALAHAAVSSPREAFQCMTMAMAIAAVPLVVVAPAAGVALLAPVLFSRRLANAQIPATVDELLERSRP